MCKKFKDCAYLYSDKWLRFYYKIGFVTDKAQFGF